MGARGLTWRHGAALAVVGGAAGVGLVGVALAVGALAGRRAAAGGREQLVDAAPDAIVALDVRGRVTGWNAAAARLLGYRAAEAVGVALSRFADAAGAPVFETAMRRALDGGEAWLPGVALRSRAGEPVVVSACMAPIRGPSGRIDGAVVVMHARVAQEAAEEIAADDPRGRSGAERVRDLIEKAPEGILVVGPDDRYTDVNAAACELLGFRREEVVGRRLGVLSPPESHPALAALRARLAAEGTLTIEWTARHADGRAIPLEVRARMLPDGSWHAFLRDVSAYKNAAEWARKNAEDERRRRSQVEAVDSALERVTQAVADVRDAGIEAVLQAIALQAVSITGAEFAAAALGVRAGEPMEHFCFAGQVAGVAEKLGRHPRCVGLLATVARSTRPLRLRDVRAHPEFGGLPPGHPEVQSLLGMPIRDGTRLLGLLLLANRRDGQEFSDEDQVAVELLVSRVVFALHAARGMETETSQRAWLQNVIEDMPDGVVVVDRDGRRVSLNRVATELSREGGEGRGGVPVAETFEAVRPDGRPVGAEEIPVLRALATGDTLTDVELSVRDGHGRMTPVMVSAAPINSGSGDRLGAVMVVRDISSFKELERLREEWSALVAHELKQPLGQIAAWAEVLFRRAARSSDAADLQTAEQIRNGVRRMSRMVADLLDVSRLEAHQLELTIGDVDLARLIRAAAERATQAAPDHPVRVEIPATLTTLRADELRLEQVMDNLLSNAAKYGRPGSQVLVEAAERSGEVVVRVTNSGRGLEPEEQARLFERFYRARSRGAGRVAGSGLGLYIARGILQAHGGRIWVESTPGAFTTFGFALPVPAAPGVQRSA